MGCCISAISGKLLDKNYGTLSSTFPTALNNKNNNLTMLWHLGHI